MTAAIVIITLKLLVVVVTLILLMSLISLARGNVRLHGQLNTLFFCLTMITIIGLEVVVRLVWPELSEQFFAESAPIARPLRVHLCFSIPAATLLPAMLYTGKYGHKTMHLILASLFSALWLGTLITGLLLPQSI